MEDIVDESYEFEEIDNTETNVKYDFVSKGDKEVPKRVMLTKYELPGLENYYNLGFGNLSIDKDGIEHISDMSRDNNKDDKDKVLKTVLTCTLDFVSNLSESVITFYGNTSAKHRMYKMGLNKNLEGIKKYFNIKGGIINDLVTEETKEDGKRPVSQINIESIEYEEYKSEKSREYNFITFELKDDLK